MDYLAAKAFILEKLEKELSEQLSYHGKHHTLDVLAIAKELCAAENIGPYDTILVKTAALYHDSGFTISNKDHETLGCQIARSSLEQFYYSSGEIETICGMIMATKIPQSPKNSLEEIICDADLDYLGGDEFHLIGDKLKRELMERDAVTSDKQWDELQVKFLESHTYFTKTAIKLRRQNKLDRLEEVKERLKTYE